VPVIRVEIDRSCAYNRGVPTDPRGGGNGRGAARRVVGLALLALSCGGSSLSSSATCQKLMCANAAAGTYQACSQPNGNIDYDTGEELCTCPPGNPNQCLLCAQILAGYCGSALTAEPSDAGSGSCTATFSGAVSGMAPWCAVTIMYAPLAGVSSVSAKGGSITTTPYYWGVDFVLNGVLALGTFDQTQGVQASAYLDDESPGMLPNWAATINSGPPIGDATLEITSLGPAVDVDGQTFYQSAHGTWTGKLVYERPQPAQPDVALTITF
jgi:hypothetical protein